MSVLQLRQPRVGQMDVGEAIVALAPGFRRTFDISEHRRRDRSAVGCRQQRQNSRFLAFQALQPVRAVCRNQNSASSQHEALWRERQHGANGNGPFARTPSVAQAFLQHALCPLLDFWMAPLIGGAL